MQNKSVVSIVAWQAISAVCPEIARPIGGLETSAWSFAKMLAHSGRHQTRFTVRSPSTIKLRQVENVELAVHVDKFLEQRRRFSSFRESEQKLNIGKLTQWFLDAAVLLATRPFRRRDPLPMSTDWRLLQQSIPNLWVAMGVNRDSAGVIATAMSQKLPSLLMIRSNMDVDPQLNQEGFITRYGDQAEWCKFAIENATTIVCQTKTQQRMLLEAFGRTSELLLNPVDVAKWAKTNANSSGEWRANTDVLWIGRFDNFHKRIDLALEIAKRLPKVHFQFISQPFDQVLEKSIRHTVPTNVEICDRVDFDAMPAAFLGCRCLLATGSQAYEGFPNVFLQAAAADKPIVSLQDFDGFLNASGAGIVCQDNIDQAAHGVEAILSHQLQIDRQRVHDYLMENHSYEVIQNKLISIVDTVLSR